MMEEEISLEERIAFRHNANAETTQVTTQERDSKFEPFTLFEDFSNLPNKQDPVPLTLIYRDRVIEGREEVN